MENCLSTSKKRWLSIANCENLPEAICRNSFSGVIFELRVDQQAIKIATYWSTRDIPSVHPGMGTKSTNNFPDRTHVEKMFSPFIKYGICLAPRMCIQETWKRLKNRVSQFPRLGRSWVEGLPGWMPSTNWVNHWTMAIWTMVILSPTWQSNMAIDSIDHP